MEESVISKNMNGKYLRTMICEVWNFAETSEDDFTVVSLQTSTSKEVIVHLKFYPVEPIEGNIMIDYDFKFIRYICSY